MLSNMATAKVINLRELIEYQEGAVVSRTILETETGTVTLFAFTVGQGLSEHTAPFDALVYLLEGEADVSLSGQTLRVHEGEFVIMPANDPHALKAVKNFKMLLIMLQSP